VTTLKNKYIKGLIRMEKKKETGIDITKLVTRIVMSCIVVILVFGSVYNVPKGSAGVKFSKLTAFDYSEKPQGLGLKIPFIENVNKMSFRTKTLNLIGDAELTPKDKNGINFRQEIVIRYRLTFDQAVEFYELKGKDTDAVVYTATRGASRNVFGKYIQEEVPEKRGEIADLIRSELQSRINTEKSGKLHDDYILIEAVDVRNTAFNQQIEEAINRKQVQKQVAEQKQYELQAAEKQREIVKVNADAKKQKAILEAEGEAQAIIEVATAKARGVQKINDAYQQMPREYVLVKFAEAIRPTDKVYLGFESLTGGQNLGVLNYNQLMALQEGNTLNITR